MFGLACLFYKKIVVPWCVRLAAKVEFFSSWKFFIVGHVSIETDKFDIMRIEGRVLLKKQMSRMYLVLIPGNGTIPGCEKWLTSQNATFCLLYNLTKINRLAYFNPLLFTCRNCPVDQIQCSDPPDKSSSE